MKLPFTVVATREPRPSVIQPQGSSECRKVGLITSKEGVVVISDQQIVQALQENQQE